MKRWEIALLAGLVLAVALSDFGTFATACGAVCDDTLRLHILAQSDSAQHQADKLAVRDAVLAAYGDVLAKAGSKAQAKALAQQNLAGIARVANATLQARGCAATATATLERTTFATRAYDGVTLPAGEYDAVRIVIGSGQGHNWFCVMYPPLCLPAASKGALRVYTSEEQTALETPYVVKFAALELLQQLQENAS